MKYPYNLILLLLQLLALPSLAQTNVKIPHLRKSGSATHLVVEGKPFLMLGGELGNSSGASLQYLQPIWPKLKAMNLNTVLVPVYWELMEEEEGKFDFQLIDGIINEARKNDLKLVFLWFGSWKNSMSCYAPSWVKRNQQRFPRAQDKDGRSQEILSPFSKNNLEADKKAFVQLMKHLKQTDEKQQTVIMIQVENEIGMLPSARDYHPAATKQFSQQVPSELISYLSKNKQNLVPEFQAIWKEKGFKTAGNWEEIFGKSLATDEIFMSWYFARYVEEITAAGKKEYPLPMFLNAALFRKDQRPGQYPSAGPLPQVFDIWKAGAPSIDFLSPDFYNPNFRYWNDLYTRQNNPLFIPEIRFEPSNAAKAFFAFGHYEAMGFSPFSIESTDKPEEENIGKAYKILGNINSFLLEKQGQNALEGVLLDKEKPTETIKKSVYTLTVSHDHTLGWTPASKETGAWPETGAAIIQTGSDEFIIAGSGIVVTFTSNDSKSTAGIEMAEEGKFNNGKWETILRLNGDQTHQGRHLRIPYNEYQIQKIKLYQYK